MKQHHRCSASKRLYTYGTIDVPPGPRTRRAAEERRIRIPTPAERRPALWWRTPVQVQTPNKGSPLPGRRRRKKEILVCWKKGGFPSLYRPRGVLSSSPPPCGTKLPRGGVRRPRGVVGPTLGAKPKGGDPLLP